jgi:hypothetical protein
MAGTVKIDLRNFNAMCRELSAKAKTPNEQVLIGEVGKVLEAAIRNTDAAQASLIRRRSESAEFSMQPESLYNPVSGRSNVNITKSGFIAYYLENRYPNALWNAIAVRREASLQAKLRARGLAKKSWLQIAQQLGITIQAPGYVAGAVASTGREYKNTSTKLARQTGKLQITILNSQPTVNAIGGARALQRACDGRVKFFLQNVALGTFNDAAKTAKRYPGIKIMS